MSNQVHAPYHFVPLSKWVYLPEWAHLVSHDHPFEDGLSGSINIKLTNKTELLVGANTTKQDGQPAMVHWAKASDGKPVIPGSSLKGMVRSFLEAATFAKFKQIDDNRYAYRDISGSDTGYSDMLKKTKLSTAWLRFDSKTNTWVYRSCNHTKIFHQDLNTALALKTKIVNDEKQMQMALDKYSILPLNSKPLSFDIDIKKTKKSSYTYAVNLNKGKLQGQVVFVGHRIGSNKSLDFSYIFYDEKDHEETIKTQLVNQMFAAHEEDLVNYLKQHGHPEYGIPVFMRKSNDRNSKVVALGLAKMPKMLYDESVSSLANTQQAGWVQNNLSFDLCELMFGTLRDYGIGLKSRVSFSDAQCIKNTGFKNSSPIILGQPQASYLNAYLEQQHNNGDVRGELTKYDKGAKLAGWKRYPAQAKFSAHLPDDLKNKVNVQSKLELLNPSAEFAGKIVFHNLKPVELGALLWALNPNDQFYHGLGHGKSLGAGAVQLQAKLNLSHSQEALTTKDLIEQFIEHMNAQHPANNENNTSWENSAQVQHLLAFGDLADNKGKNLTYMPLQKNKMDTAISYADSKVSGKRKALPKWQAHGQDLERSETLTNVPEYFAQGRLSSLVNKLLDDKQRESNEAAKQKWEAEQAKQHLESQKENASDIFKRVLDLQEHLEQYRNNASQDAQNQRISKHTEITEILQQVVAGNSGASISECQAIHDFAIDFEFTAYFNPNVKAKELSKKQKPKHQEKQALLEQLAELIK